MERGKKSKAEAEAEAEALTVPVGFRFNPTDVELVTFYLARMLRSECVPLDLIHRANVYDFHPQKLTEIYASTELAAFSNAASEKAASTKNDWYFFTPREAKYSKGSMPNRKADNGYWKATGSFLKVTHRGQLVSRKRSLVFHELHQDSNPRNATKTNWIMHEYVSNEQQHEMAQFDSWVLCRIHYHGKQKQSAIGSSELASSFDGLLPSNSQVPTQTTSSNYTTMNNTKTMSSFSTNLPTIATDNNDCSNYDEPSNDHSLANVPTEEHATVLTDGPSDEDDRFVDRLWDYIFMVSEPTDLPTYEEPATLPTDGPSDDHLLADQPIEKPTTIPTEGPSDDHSLVDLPTEEPATVPTDGPSNDHFGAQLCDYNCMVPAAIDLPTYEPELATKLSGVPSNSFITPVPLTTIVPKDVTTTTSDGNHMPWPDDATIDQPISTLSWLRGSWEEFDDKSFSDLLDELDY